MDTIRPYESRSLGNGGSSSGSSPSREVGAGFEPSVGGNGSFRGGGSLKSLDI